MMKTGMKTGLLRSAKGEELAEARKQRDQGIVLWRAQSIHPTLKPEGDIAPKPKITSLPLEIKNHIFSYLSPNDSTCLGLASKELYHVHRSLHGIVSLISPLTTLPIGVPFGRRERMLAERIREWFGDDYVRDWRVRNAGDSCVFVLRTGRKLCK